jgi:ribonuclease P protein component
VITGITDRTTFERLKTSGRRVRFGSVSVVFLDDEAERVRVAYAIGKRFGGAVGRNRLRRRFRAAMRTVESETTLKPGAYLIIPGQRTPELAYEELVETLTEAVIRAQALGQ